MGMETIAPQRLTIPPVPEPEPEPETYAMMLAGLGMKGGHFVLVNRRPPRPDHRAIDNRRELRLYDSTVGFQPDAGIVSMHRETLQPLTGTDTLPSYTGHICKSSVPRKLYLEEVAQFDGMMLWPSRVFVELIDSLCFTVF